MRYLLLLLLFPSLSYAGQCPVGYGVGNNLISAPNMVCIPFSASDIGGCLAYCGGSAGSSVCVEFPNASPPSKGPYVTSGSPCGYDGESPGTGNSTDTNTGSDGGNYVGRMVVGPDVITDIGLGFNSVSKNVVTGSNSIKSAIDTFSNKLISKIDLNNDRYMQFITSDIARIAQNTTALGENAATTVDHEMAGYLKSINDKSVLDPTMWNNHHADLMQMLSDVRKDMSYMGGFPNQQELININQNTNSMSKELVNISENSNSLKGTLWNISDEVQRQGYDISDMLKELKKISSGQGGDGEGGADGEGDGDNPCEGPLCAFTPPSSSGSGSGLSSVFGEQDIAGIKQQVTERKADIQKQMDQIKGVFSPGKLEISGTYDNDYQDIHGARIDLSGKSNFELFFSSGPKQVLWFLAVLIAFGILLGGRKDA